MANNSQKAKANMLKLWSSKNFTNRAMYMLTGFDEVISNPRYKDYLYYIDMAYDLIAPELSMENNQTRPSKTLATIAFFNSLRPQDYQNLIKMCQTEKPTTIELKQFLMQDIDYQPTEKVIDYLTFPVVAEMASHLRPAPKSEILLLKPDLIHRTLDSVRSITLKKLLTDNDLMVLRMRVPKDLQDDLKINEVPIASWNIHVTTGCGPNDSRTLDLHIVEAQSHWADVRDARKVTAQTGISRQISLWRQRHNIKE